MSEYDINEITIGDVKKNFSDIIVIGWTSVVYGCYPDVQHETNKMSYSNGYVPVNSTFGPWILPRAGGGGGSVPYAYGGIHGQFQYKPSLVIIGAGWFFNNVSFYYSGGQFYGTYHDWSSYAYAVTFLGFPLSETTVNNNDPYIISTSSTYVSAFNPICTSSVLYTESYTGSFQTTVAGTPNGQIVAFLEYNGVIQINYQSALEILLEALD